LTFPNIDDVKKLEKLLIQHPDKYFRCECCEGIFMKGSTEEQMMEEYRKNFPNDPERKMPCGIICDDCYEEILEEFDGFKKKPNLMMEYYKQWSIDEG